MKSKEQVLVPVKTPWMISSSVPLLGGIREDGSKLSVRFIAFFQCHDYTLTNTDPSLSFRVQPVSDFVENKDNKTNNFHLLQADFEGVFIVRTLPAATDIEVIREDDYNWSQVPSGLLDGETVDESLCRVRDLWLANNLCPDPRMYEVINSRWLAELNLPDEKFHHYLLLGHDDYVEVVASGWNWRKGQPVA